MAPRKLLILVLSSFLATMAGAQEQAPIPHPPVPKPPELPGIPDLPDFWQPIAREMRDFYALKKPLPVGPVPPLQCHVVLEVTAIIWGLPHLNVGNRLRLHGPHPVWGSWNITPVNGPSPWTHPWKNGVYTASPIYGLSDEFLVSSVSVKPHGSPGSERKHLYRMKIRGWHPEDKCPQYVDFFNLAHDGEAISDDPGHAGTQR